MRPNFVPTDNSSTLHDDCAGVAPKVPAQKRVASGIQVTTGDPRFGKPMHQKTQYPAVQYLIDCRAPRLSSEPHQDRQ